MCPVCGDLLNLGDGTLICAGRHSFDIAREGYVNLLPGNNKIRRERGDNREMIASRRKVFDSAVYAPLSDMIMELTKESLLSGSGRGASGVARKVLETGCGEGYYLGQLQNHLQYRDPLLFYGMDISKDAVKSAARRYPGISFFVADIYEKILLPDRSVDIILNIFSPRNFKEFYRVLSDNGSLIIVLPADDHLIEMRKKFNLMDVQKDKVSRLLKQAGDLFTVRDRNRLTFELNLRGDLLSEFIRMTPNYRHLSHAFINKFKENAELKTRANFIILRLHPISGHSSRTA